MTAFRYLSLLALPLLALPALATAPRRDDLGRALYTNCAACHGPQGQGGFGPPLAGDPNLAATDYAIGYVLAGSQRMPSFAGQLSPEDVAAVLSYVRQSWGNAAGPVTVAQVEKVASAKRVGASRQ